MVISRGRTNRLRLEQENGGTAGAIAFYYCTTLSGLSGLVMEAIKLICRRERRALRTPPLPPGRTRHSFQSAVVLFHRRDGRGIFHRGTSVKATFIPNFCVSHSARVIPSFVPDHAQAPVPREYSANIRCKLRRRDRLRNACRRSEPPATRLPSRGGSGPLSPLRSALAPGRRGLDQYLGKPRPAGADQFPHGRRRHPTPDFFPKFRLEASPALTSPCIFLATHRRAM